MISVRASVRVMVGSVITTRVAMRAASLVGIQAYHEALKLLGMPKQLPPPMSFLKGGLGLASGLASEPGLVTLCSPVP